MTFYYYMCRSWQDCCRRGENRSWPSVSVESVDSVCWCLNNAIFHAFIVRLTLEERVFIDIYMSTGYYVIVWRCAPYRQIVTSELVRLFSRWPWNTLRNCVCGVACCRKEWGKRYTNRRMESGLWGGRKTVNRKRKLSAVFLQPIQDRGLYRTEEWFYKEPCFP
jgi:hypothetical protein